LRLIIRHERRDLAAYCEHLPNDPGICGSKT